MARGWRQPRTTELRCCCGALSSTQNSRILENKRTNIISSQRIQCGAFVSRTSSCQRIGSAAILARNHNPSTWIGCYLLLYIFRQCTRKLKRWHRISKILSRRPKTRGIEENGPSVMLISMTHMSTPTWAISLPALLMCSESWSIWYYLGNRPGKIFTCVLLHKHDKHSCVRWCW